MTSPRRIRLVIVDDHFLVRIGLVQASNSEPDLELVGEGGDGAEAIELYERLRPDVMIMDVRLPKISGPEATQRICAKHPSAKILMLSTYSGGEEIHRALRAGAMGYLLKTTSRADFLTAIRAVAAGQKWITDDIAQMLAQSYPHQNFSPREMEVLARLVKGESNKQIAGALFIAEITVKNHVSSILSKLRVADRTQAVSAAVQRGLIYLD